VLVDTGLGDIALTAGAPDHRRLAASLAAVRLDCHSPSDRARRLRAR